MAGSIFLCLLVLQLARTQQAHSQTTSEDDKASPQGSLVFVTSPKQPKRDTPLKQSSQAIESTISLISSVDASLKQQCRGNQFNSDKQRPPLQPIFRQQSTATTIGNSALRFTKKKSPRESFVACLRERSVSDKGSVSDLLSLKIVSTCSQNSDFSQETVCEVQIEEKRSASLQKQSSTDLFEALTSIGENQIENIPEDEKQYVYVTDELVHDDVQLMLHSTDLDHEPLQNVVAVPIETETVSISQDGNQQTRSSSNFATDVAGNFSLALQQISPEGVLVPAPIEPILESDESSEYIPNPGTITCQELLLGVPQVDATIVNELNVDTRPLKQTKRGDAESKQLYTEKMPENLAALTQGTYHQAPLVGCGCSRYRSGNLALWAAPKFHHRPLYFEQPNLERYGHYVHGQCVQSAISASHFFGSIPLLPYKIGANHPLSCDYTLGRYRPGNCNPRRRDIPELSSRGLINQGLFMSGATFLVP